MYFGIKFYVSNQLTSTAVLSLATQVTADDTVVIAGVTFTFKAAPAAAGEVDIGANVDGTRANLATLINAPDTTTATGIALSAADQLTFQTISAVNDNTANTLTVTALGIGVLDVSETLTDGTDAWTATKQLQRNLFGVVGNPVLVVQREPSVKVVPAQDMLADYYINGVLFGTKTFTDNGKQMVDVRVRCDAYSA